MMEDCDERAWLIGQVELGPLYRPVHVSQQEEGREQRLFMQRMSTAMKHVYGEWHDPIVVAITGLMYGKKIRRHAAAKQREVMLKNGPPI
jgi:hypothetical protein